MDEVKSAKENKVKDIPPIPIKTYKWEDIRREKERGLYPYTHLNKQPYNQKVDPADYRMDTLRTSKSASTLEKSSSGVDIQDVTEKVADSGKDYLEVNEGIVEAADSSNEDNVSQYLDKDEDAPVIMEHLEVPGPSKQEEKMDVDDDRQEQRAKSEEPKRKRKLSIESSYSRISLSKLGVMKKLREAKEKLKLPKFSFSKSESKLDIPKKSKKENKKATGKEGAKKTLDTYLKPKIDDKPVYIHIPLKPPAGETDEFSYLEFEDPKSEATSTPTNVSIKEPEEETPDEIEPPKEKEGVQFIILTAPSDDETLDSNVILPDTPSSEGGKKFFENVKLKDLKSLAKECVDEIHPDMPIEGIYFEDVVQVEFVDEHNRPIGTTERTNILEITEENLPKLEKKLSHRNLAKELEKEIASSMDSLNKIARQNTLKRLKEQHKSISNEALKNIEGTKPKTTQEAPELTSIPKPSIEITEIAEQVPETVKKEEVKPKEEAKIKPAKNEESKSKESVENGQDAKPKIVSEEKKEIPKQPDEKSQALQASKEVMYDEEDGLKLSEAAVQMINEELAKEQLPQTNEEQLKAAAKTASVKKKVSFKRRSKQDDPDRVYEDVRVTSDSKKVDGKEQQTKELKVIEPSQSMSVDEEKSYLDEKIIKMTSLEEDYNKWSKLTDHEYEPVNPPVDSTAEQLPPPPPPPEIQVTDAPVKRTSSKESKKSRPDSIRIPLKDEDQVQSDEEIESGDVLTVEEMQARIEDQYFNKASPSSQQADSAANETPASNTTNEKESAPQEGHAKKIQDAFKTQAGKLRTKIKSIKKPNLHMPSRPNFEKLKMQKPNITMPKIPDHIRLNLPSFTLPKKSKRTPPPKQCSTESNVGDSKKKRFDFSTYPRIFKKKKKTDDFGDDDFNISATVPRSKKSSKGRQDNSGKAKESEKNHKKSPDVIRIPLHTEESMDKEENDLSSRGRYEEENIDMDDAYVRESQQLNTASTFNTSDFSRNRWNHGSFHGHNLNEIPGNENQPKDVELNHEMERPQTSSEPELELELEMDSERRHSDMRSVSSSGDVHRPRVLEKFNSDEYFMQLGSNYASSELREAFKEPTNQLAKLQTDDSFDREFDVSDHSIQEIRKRKPIKKPKRKKTPNVSRERIPYDQESETEEYPEPYMQEEPARPKRKNKEAKNVQNDRPPYQETIFVQDPEFDVMREAASDNILLTNREAEENFQNNKFRQEHPQYYENNKMQGIEQPDILISDPYQKKRFQYNEDDHLARYEMPEAPPRKQRSLKSLASEHDSIIDELNLPKQEMPPQIIEVNKFEHEYIIPATKEPPVRPARSRTRSHSRLTDQSEDEPPLTAEPETPCIEEPCVQQVCDYMGYAVINKDRHREPPLPPPARKKRSTKSDNKFFTVPRPLKEEAPVRPVRNYSTLVPKSKRSPQNLSEEEKENVDLGQYIEIDDEGGHSRLQSGEIVQKMKDRPLPAPPRPPRKTRDCEKDNPFKDITHENNLEEEAPLKIRMDEVEAAVQTEPLPDDVVCEELVQEMGDKIIIPTTSKYHRPITEFENVETVTHGALVVTPVAEDFEEGPITSFSRSTEKIITIRREVDDEDSQIPESFQTFKEPQPKIIERIIERPISSSPEVEVLKAHKLQVSDLDVDRLTVNELLASKIKVSEIDGETICVAEINPKSGNLVIGGLELPVGLIQDILEKLKSAQGISEPQAHTPHQTSEDFSKEKNVSGTLIKEGENQKETAEDGTIATPSGNNDHSKPDQEKSEDPKFLKKDIPPKPEERNLPTQPEETNLSSKDEQVETPTETKTNLFEPDSELSPTTLKTTIEYLDDLIMEENIKQNIEENAKKIVHEVLEAAIKSKAERNTSLFSERHTPFEKSESAELHEIPPLITDSSEEERLIEELKNSSLEQKKNSD